MTDLAIKTRKNPLDDLFPNNDPVKQNKNPLDDCFVNNEPVVIHLKKKQAEDKAREIETERRATVVDITRLRPKVPCKVRYPEETKRVSRRVRHLSDREIRREYGIMAKPYNTLVENTLWMVLEKGPVTAKEIAKETGESISSISATLSRIYKRLGGKGGLIELITDKKPYTYRATKPMSVEAAYQLFLDIPRQKREARKKPFRAEVPLGPPPLKDTPGTGDTEGTEPGTKPETPPAARPTVGMGIPENININVKFSWEGTVKFLFGLLRE